MSKCIGLVSHLMLTHLSSAPSAQSECGLSDWDWSIQTTTYSERAARGSSNHPLRVTLHIQSRVMICKTEGCWPHMLSLFFRIYHPAWTCGELSVPLISVAKPSRRLTRQVGLGTQIQSPFKWPWLSQDKRKVKGMQLCACCSYKDTHAQRRNGSSCGLGDNYRRVNKNCVWKVFEKGVVMQDYLHDL